MGRRDRIEAVRVVGFDDHLGVVLPDGARERHHMDDRRTSLEDALRSHQHCRMSEAGFAALRRAEVEIYDVTRGRHRAMQPRRSEEHTTELQSLMRTSYAVFCWNRKNINT